MPQRLLCSPGSYRYRYSAKSFLHSTSQAGCITAWLSWGSPRCIAKAATYTASSYFLMVSSCMLLLSSDCAPLDRGEYECTCAASALAAMTVMVPLSVNRSEAQSIHVA